MIRFMSLVDDIHGDLSVVRSDLQRQAFNFGLGALETVWTMFTEHSLNIQNFRAKRVISAETQ